MILSLRANGIIIAVCSKNEMENALIPFRSHPDMLIKEEDISVFVANWDDKASNIENIASKLNIGIESIVFLDDNPFERELVRNALPQVAVPELSNDPSTFVRDFLEARYFETIAITEEDKMRPINYKQNADRSESIKNSRNIKEYLKTLEMELEVGTVYPSNEERVTQLINKTNQFNLTGHRYTKADVQNKSKDPNHIFLQARLKDRFGDNGIISVLDAQIDDRCCKINLWVMSCRVFGREVEFGIFKALCSLVKEHKTMKILGTYVPTEKNSIVAGLYERLGFKVSFQSSTETIWEKLISDDQLDYSDLPMSLKINGIAND